MNTEQLEDLLERRLEAHLEWVEMRRSVGPEGNDLDAFIKVSASVHDCINLQRAVAKKAGRATMGNDGQFLLDFIIANWAAEAKPRE